MAGESQCGACGAFHGCAGAYFRKDCKAYNVDDRWPGKTVKETNPDELPEFANGYRVVGRCTCGELLTMRRLLTSRQGTNLNDISDDDVDLVHVNNYRRACGSPLAHIAQRRGVMGG